MAREKTAGDLHMAIEAEVGQGIVLSVRIGRRNDRSTWDVLFTPDATDDHKLRTAAVVAGWSFDGMINDAPPAENAATVRDLAFMAGELAKAKDELAQIKADMRAFIESAVAAAVGAKS